MNASIKRLAEKRIEMQENQKKNECCDKQSKVRGVVCDVKNCAYHDGVNDCYAGSICVGPREADCSAKTSCATFKPRECN